MLSFLDNESDQIVSFHAMQLTGWEFAHLFWHGDGL